MYEVLAGNRVRKMPEMKKPYSGNYCGGLGNPNYQDAMKAYQEAIEKQTEYPISGSHNWKEGQLIEEGKDFRFESGKAYSGGEWKVAVPIQPLPLYSSEIFIPGRTMPHENPEELYSIGRTTPSVTNEEDELWKEIFYYAEIHFGTKWFGYADEFREHLKNTYTIKKK